MKRIEEERYSLSMRIFERIHNFRMSRALHPVSDPIHTLSNRPFCFPLFQIYFSRDRPFFPPLLLHDVHERDSICCNILARMRDAQVSVKPMFTFFTIFCYRNSLVGGNWLGKRPRDRQWQWELHVRGHKNRNNDDFTIKMKTKNRWGCRI